MPNAIEIFDIKKDYKLSGKKNDNLSVVNALKGISMNVRQGDIFALLGPNGAGKTTLFSILTTLRKPTSGKVNILGMDLSEQKQNIRKHIGIVFQEPALDLRLTVHDNLYIMGLLHGLRSKELKNRIDEILELLDLDKFQKRLAKELSGGQKRSLELARALMPKPEILFLDEATLGLDVEARRSFWKVVKTLSDNGATIFFTTHYMEEADISDQIAMLDDGNIQVIGTPSELKEKYSANNLEDVFIALTGKGLKRE